MQASAAGVQPGAPSGPARPDGVPDALWDAATGFKVTDAVTQLNALQAFKAQHDSRAAAVPEKPDGYQLKLPADFKMADGSTFELDPSHPMVAFGRDAAHLMRADQPGFEKLVALYAQHQAAEAKQISDLLAKQMEALGPRGPDRVAAIKNFLTAKLGEDAVTVFSPVLQLKNGVEAVESLMRLITSGGVPGFSQAGRTGAVSEQQPLAKRLFPGMN